MNYTNLTIKEKLDLLQEMFNGSYKEKHKHIIINKKVIAVGISALLLLSTGCAQKEYLEHPINNISYFYNEERVNNTMKDQGIEYYAKDIEAGETKNKIFLIEGKAEISDYYPHQRFSEDFYSIKITPIKNTGTQTWYLYFSKFDSKELYDVLSKTSSIKVIAVGIYQGTTEEGYIAKGYYCGYYFP